MSKRRKLTHTQSPLTGGSGGVSPPPSCHLAVNSREEMQTGNDSSPPSLNDGGESGTSGTAGGFTHVRLTKKGPLYAVLCTRIKAEFSEYVSVDEIGTKKLAPHTHVQVRCAKLSFLKELIERVYREHKVTNPGNTSHGGFRTDETSQRGRQYMCKGTDESTPPTDYSGFTAEEVAEYHRLYWLEHATRPGAGKTFSQQVHYRSLQVLKKRHGEGPYELQQITQTVFDCVRREDQEIPAMLRDFVLPGIVLSIWTKHGPEENARRSFEYAVMSKIIYEK